MASSVQVQWRMKQKERLKPGDGVWRNHSEMDRRTAEQMVPIYTRNSYFFEYRAIEKRNHR